MRHGGLPDVLNQKRFAQTKVHNIGPCHVHQPLPYQSMKSSIASRMYYLKLLLFFHSRQLAVQLRLPNRSRRRLQPKGHN